MSIALEASSIVLKKCSDGYQIKVGAQEFMSAILKAIYANNLDQVDEINARYVIDKNQSPYYPLETATLDIMMLLNDPTDPNRAAKTEKLLTILQEHLSAFPHMVWEHQFWGAVCAFEQKNYAKAQQYFSEIYADHMCRPNERLYFLNFPFISELSRHLNKAHMAKLGGTGKLLTELLSYVEDHPEILPDTSPGALQDTRQKG